MFFSTFQYITFLHIEQNYTYNTFHKNCHFHIWRSEIKHNFFVNIKFPFIFFKIKCLLKTFEIMWKGNTNSKVQTTGFDHRNKQIHYSYLALKVNNDL